MTNQKGESALETSRPSPIGILGYTGSLEILSILVEAEQKGENVDLDFLVSQFERVLSPERELSPDLAVISAVCRDRDDHMKIIWDFLKGFADEGYVAIVLTEKGREVWRILERMANGEEQ